MLSNQCLLLGHGWVDKRLGSGEHLSLPLGAERATANIRKPYLLSASPPNVGSQFDAVRIAVRRENHGRNR